MVSFHSLSRLPRRVISLVASAVMVLAVVPAVTLLTATAANAAGNPVQVNSTLEGCRRPAALAKCTYNAQQNQSDFTTGDLGKEWAELDFVPHRLTLQNNGADQTFSIELAADNMLNGKLGYDLIKQGWDSTFNTAAVNMFTGDCGASPSVTEANNHESGIVGGIDTTLTTKLTLHLAPGDVCFVSYEVRLGLGAHLFSGSSLQTQILNGDDTSAGQKTVSIPVKEIAPQVATTTASASTNTNFTWAVNKSATPDTININSCDPAATEPNVGFTVNYTRTEHTGTGLHVTGTITVKNPGVRTLTTHNITDTVTDSDGSGPYPATVADTTITVGPADANGPGIATTTFAVDIPLPVGTLSNSATVTYDDPDQPGQVLAGLTTASTPVTVSVTQTTSNSTADITDTEDFVGAANGLQFKRTSTPAMSAFAASDTFNKNGVTGSGSYSISKIVKATTPGNFNATLRDAVSLLPSDGGTSSASDDPATAHADVTIHVTAANPTIAITKNVNVAPTSNATFNFTITNNQDNTTYPTSVTVLANQTSGTGSAISVTPSNAGYTITETPAAGYSGTTTNIGNLALCGSATPTINNTRLLGAVRVHKLLDGPAADADTHFTFSVSCDNGYTTTLNVTGEGFDTTGNAIPTGTSCTITEDLPLPGGWTFKTSVPDDGGAVSSQTNGAGNTVTITNLRDVGEIKIVKSLQGDVAGASTSFSFDWSCASEDQTYSDSGTVTIDPVNDLHPYKIVGDIPTGVECTVTENPASDANWELTTSNGVAVTSAATDSSANTASFTNTRKLGRLVVNKTVTGPIADAPLTFTFEYSCADGAYTGTISVTVDATTKTGTNHSASDIPVGVTCTIAEQGPDGHWTLTTTVPDEGSATSEAGTTEGNTVSFTNDRVLGAIQVQKVLDGPVAGAEHSFTFSVVCASQDGTYQHTFTPTIDPTVDDTWTSGAVIPTGVSCTVTETGTYAHWQLETVSPESGIAVSGAEDNLVIVTNARDFGHVTVVKVLDGDIAGAETVFTFHVECPGVDQELLPDLTVDAALTDSASTDDVIPTGVECTVTEIGTYEHWTLESVSPSDPENEVIGAATSTAEDGTANTVTFTNLRDVGQIEVDKTRLGEVAGAQTVFTFDITCPDFPAYDQQVVVDTTDSSTASNSSGDIPTGVSCTVTEGATPGGQQTVPDVGGRDVTVPGSAAFTNQRLTGPLQLVKSVTPDTGSYNPADANNTLTYTLTLSEPAPGQLDHTNVVVTDYIPGFDPADTTSGKTTYVDGSATCATGCPVSYDSDKHLLTWDVGNYNHDDAPLVMTFKVTIDRPTPAADGAIPAEQIDNVGFVASLQQPKTPSNEVVVPVIAVLGEKVVKPPTEPEVLPFTGSALPVRASAYLGGLLIAVGVALSATTRRRRRQMEI